MNAENTIASADEKPAKQVVRLSLIFSGTRCIFQYIIFPFILPILGIATNATVPILFAFNLIAIASIILSLRRFWIVSYRYRWHYLGLASFVLLLLTVFFLMDVRDLRLLV